MTKEDIKILLVDDEKQFVDTLSERLAMRGFEARVAYDGPEALKAVEQPTDVIVLDLRMPGMDGIEAIGRLRTLPGGDVPKVIAMSGLAFPEDVARSKEAGADLHLPKPVRLGQLVRLLEGMFEE